MRNATKDRLRIFYLVSLPILLALAIILGRWWAIVPLVLFAASFIRPWLRLD